MSEVDDPNTTARLTHDNKISVRLNGTEYIITARTAERLHGELANLLFQYNLLPSAQKRVASRGGTG